MAPSAIAVTTLPVCIASFSCSTSTRGGGRRSNDRLLTLPSIGVGFAISSASCASVPPPSLTCSKQKEPALQSTNERFLRTLDPEQVDVIIRKVQAAEVDEMWSFVGKKSQQH